MTAANLLSETPILKTLYPQDDIKREMSQLSPFYAMMEKREDFVGANLVLALRIAATGGRSRTFSNAQANKSGAVLGKFTVTRSRDYSVYSIDGETILACGDDEGAITDAVTTEVDAAMDAIKLNTGRSIYRNFGGAIGQIATTSNVSTTTITLADPNTAIFFEDGQVLNSAPTDGTSGSVNLGANVLAAVDNVVGTLVGLLQWNLAIPAISAAANPTYGDWLFTDGDFGNSCYGLDSWAPATAPGAALFFGLNRSIASRYSGTRAQNTAGAQPEEAIQRGLQQLFKQGGKSKNVFENDQDFLGLVLSLGSRVIYNDVEVDADIGFEGVKVVGPYGPVTVLPDSNCQQGVAWAPDLDSWSFRSLKEFPQFLDLDKLGRMVRETSSDSYEGRIGGYYQTMTDAPVRTARIPL
jgi:hypothetical protein